MNLTPREKDNLIIAMAATAAVGVSIAASSSTIPAAVALITRFCAGGRARGKPSPT